MKINDAKDFKRKDRYLKRNAGNIARINKSLNGIETYITPVYQKLNATKAEKLSNLNRVAVEINNSLDTLVKASEKEMAAALKDSETSNEAALLFWLF